MGARTASEREQVAFNDVVLSRVPGRGQALLALHVDGQLLVRYASDGVIAATPIGLDRLQLRGRRPDRLAPDARDDHHARRAPRPLQPRRRARRRGEPGRRDPPVERADRGRGRRPAARAGRARAGASRSPRTRGRRCSCAWAPPASPSAHGASSASPTPPRWPTSTSQATSAEPGGQPCGRPLRWRQCSGSSGCSRNTMWSSVPEAATASHTRPARPRGRRPRARSRRRPASSGSPTCAPGSAAASAVRASWSRGVPEWSSSIPTACRCCHCVNATAMTEHDRVAVVTGAGLRARARRHARTAGRRLPRGAGRAPRGRAARDARGCRPGPRDRRPDRRRRPRCRRRPVRSRARRVRPRRRAVQQRRVVRQAGAVRRGRLRGLAGDRGDEPHRRLPVRPGGLPRR